MSTSTRSKKFENHPVRIVAASFFILLLELALIRFIPSEIKAISYFTNLLVFAAFFGLGLGCILWRKNLPAWLLPTGLMLLAGFVFFSRGITVYETDGAVHYWLQGQDTRFRPFLQIPLWATAISAFAFSAIPFVTMGWRLAREMQLHPRLPGYGYDLLGSLAGTLFFAAASWLGCPPWVLILVTACAWGLIFHADSATRLLHLFPGLVFLFSLIAPYSWKWSPYYFIQYNVDARAITIWVNSSFHQEAVNFSITEPPHKDNAQVIKEKFGLPYKIYAEHHQGRYPKKVLILGAGSGNDVNIALMQGAEHVTAVEIDPTIVDIGRKHNPLKPYQDPRVRVVVDDGRHFLRTTKDKFDVIVFGTLDSQTLLSGYANIRLDNYIYTVESFRDAREALVEGGMVFTYYSVFKEWFVHRVYKTVAMAFPGELRAHIFKDNYLFNLVIVAAKNAPKFTSHPSDDKVTQSARFSSDNWPYIYMEEPTISPLYMTVLGFIAFAILLVFILLRRLEPSRSLHSDFFFLGVGFTLMQSAAIVRLALVFGTTWIVSAIVFSTMLLTVFVGNIIVSRRPHWKTSWAWGGLLLTLLVNYYFPVQSLLELSFVTQLFAVFGLIGLPVLFAGLNFSRLFGREAEVGAPLGMNLIGAMAGGAFEYLSMVYGMRSMWLLLIGVYAIAWLCHVYRIQSQRVMS